MFVLGFVSAQVKLRPQILKSVPRMALHTLVYPRQEMVGLERRLRSDRVDDLETRCRTERHGVRDRAIQLHDGRRHELREGVVKLSDAFPVCFRGRTRAS